MSGSRCAALLVVLSAGSLASAPAAAQSRIDTDVDTTLIHVGDRVTMTVKVDHPEGATVRWPDSVDVAPFEVLGAQVGPTETTASGARTTARITLTAFELGEVEIPRFEVTVVAADVSTETLTTDRFAIAVASVGTDESGDIRDIRGVLGIPMSAMRVAIWGLLLALTVAAVFGAYRLSRRIRGSHALTTPAAPPLPAHEIALAALAALEASPLLARGQVKEYHIEVSDILRRYVERRFGVDALEMTTSEVLAGLRIAGVEAGFREGLGRFLDACDMVKFARVRPDAHASRAVLALGRELVESSVPREVGSQAPARDVVAEDEGREPVAAAMPDPGGAS